MKKVLAILLVLIMTMALCACIPDKVVDKAVSGFEESLYAGLNPEVDPNDAQVSITMLNVDQGMSVLVESNGEYMLYDGGDCGTSSYVESYLKDHGVTELKYMIASHYSTDRIAGLVGVLETTTVSTVINPAYETDTSIYESYILGVQSSGAKVIYPEVGDTYTLGKATFAILSPTKKDNASGETPISIMLNCGEFGCVIAGDAEADSEEDMMNAGVHLNSDLYIVGCSESNSETFIKHVQPEYVFICGGKNHDYDQEALDLFAKHQARIYRSDLDGEVTCFYDGIRYAFSKEPSEATNFAS